MDALAACSIAKPEDFFAEGSWGVMFRNHTVMANEVAAGIESGKLKTANDVVHALEKHVGSLEGRIPRTKTVIYLEDTPARYLRIKKGNPNIGLDCWRTASASQGHRVPKTHRRQPSKRFSRAFTDGIIPRSSLKRRISKGYEVVFDPDDKQAMEIVAKQLGMTVGEDDREFLPCKSPLPRVGII